MKNTELSDRFTTTALRIGNSLREFQTTMKLLQTFPDPYQTYNIINPSYCHLFNLTGILNLAYSGAAIFSIL